MKIIFGGHWNNPPEGWVSVPEPEQDITKRLNYDDNSVDAIFNEHVWEHLPLEGAIYFAKESLRVLKDGGILRIACPTVDKLIKFKGDELGKHYSDVQTRHYYPNEDAALKELGLEGIREEPIVFMLDSLFKGHNHRLLWTSGLIKKVLLKVGFSQVNIHEPGKTKFDKSNILERTIRGVDPVFVEKKFKITEYDPETMVIEAKK